MFKGSAVALVTPMQRDTTIDFTALKGLVEWHIASGTQALVINGTTAETPTLSWQEQLEIIQAVVETVKGKIPVIVGTGGNATQSVLKRNRQVAKMGVQGLLIVAPYYNKPLQTGLIAHFEAVADDTNLPIILYNHPGRTGVDIEVNTVVHLSKHQNISGIKDVSGDLSRLAIYKKSCPEDFQYYCGDDLNNFEFIKAGGHGVISVTANIIPMMVRSFCDAALGGDFTKAKQISEHCHPLNEALTLETNPIPIKWALYQAGKIPEGIRLPLLPFSKVLRPSLDKALKAVGD